MAHDSTKKRRVERKKNFDWKKAEASLQKIIENDPNLVVVPSRADAERWATEMRKLHFEINDQVVWDHVRQDEKGVD